MKLEDLVSIDPLVDFLSGTQAVAFSVLSDKDVCYQWIQATLFNFFQSVQIIISPPWRENGLLLLLSSSHDFCSPWSLNITLRCSQYRVRPRFQRDHVALWTAFRLDMTSKRI